MEGINCRVDDTEEQINELKDSSGNHWSWMEKKKKEVFNDDNLKELWDNIKHVNICIIGVPDGKEKETRTYLKK